MLYTYFFLAELGMIVYRISHCTCRSPYIAPSDLPPSNGDFTDLYSENSYLADQVAHLIWPTNNGDKANDKIFYWSYPKRRPLWWPHLNVRELIFGRPGVRSTPPIEQRFHRFILRELIFGRPGVGKSTPQNGNFTNSCSDSSYFIPTLKAHI